jgi:gliding motility-associated-like protein
VKGRLFNCSTYNEKQRALPLFCFLGLTVLFSAFSAQAQYTSRLGRFQVDQKKGCAPFTVTITDANLITSGDCTGSKPCLMSAGNGTAQQQNQFTITYPAAGTFTLSVLYQSIGADDIVITVDQNIQPNFEIYACSGNRASIKVTDNNYNQYVVDFQNDGIPENIIPFSNNAIAQHSYGAAGTFNISVRGRDLNSADNCTAKVQPFTTLALLPSPTISTLTSIDATSLKLDFIVQTNIQYKLEIAVNNSNSFQVFQTLYGVNTLTVPNLLIDNNYYCFRLSAFDPCSNTNAYSNTICSKDLDLVVQSGVMQLSWKTSNSGVTDIEIERNAAIYTTIPGAPTSFNDLDVDCNIEYCYKVISNYPGGTKSISLEKCGIAFVNTSPPAIDNVTSAVNGPVAFTWATNPLIKIKEFNIWRSSGSSALSLITTTPNNSPYTDASYATENAFCYQVNYSDLCENNSVEGILVCPIRLLGAIDSKNVITLTWSKYKGWKNGVSNYVVEKYNKAGSLIRTFNMALDTVLVDDQPDLTNQVVSYRVKATAVQTGLGVSISNVVTFTKEVNLTFPTAFTPNRDNLNDAFTVTGQFVAKMNIKIFDRWGSIIYASEKNEPWDGTRVGIAMPESTYIWKAEITDLAGRTFSREGTLVLIRK